MIPALAIVGYLAVHLGGYMLWWRHLGACKREGGIFAIHVASWFLLVGGAGAAALLGGRRDGLAVLILAAGLHGIYSLSFLELWALTHRSYSLAILDRIDAAGGGLLPSALEGLGEIGAVKRSVRSGSLRRLGLLAAGPEGDQLTWRGRAGARVLRGINWLGNGRPMN